MRRAGPIGAGPAALLGVTMFFWGTAFRATAVGAQHASPIVFSTLRAAPATLALLAVTALMRGRLPRDRRTLVVGAVSGILTVSLTFAGIAEATKLAGPGNAAVLTNTAPFFTVLFAWLVLGSHTPRVAIGGLVVGFGGVVIMVSSQLGGGSIEHLALGMAVALLAAAGFAVGALMIANIAVRDPGLDMFGFTAFQYVVGSLALAVAMVIYGHPQSTDWGSAALWEAVAWVALGSSATASICFNLALRRISAARATAWQFLAPVVAVVVEAARGNAPGPVVILGMALAIGGVAIVSLAHSATESVPA
ncbi:MAG TPA: DMT family transporter [Solirubrobacteraceae bacterium]|nr:DMT family transporter [Solirubrobacteraceae bacterium]